jgi:hypothetical protein
MDTFLETQTFAAVVGRLLGLQLHVDLQGY